MANYTLFLTDSITKVQLGIIAAESFSEASKKVKRKYKKTIDKLSLKNQWRITDGYNEMGIQ